jgi:hypothetical protein
LGRGFRGVGRNGVRGIASSGITGGDGRLGIIRSRRRPAGCSRGSSRRGCIVGGFGGRWGWDMRTYEVNFNER